MDHTLLLHLFLAFKRSPDRSLQKVQGHRTAQGHRAGVDVDVTQPTGGPVGHPPNPATLCDRIAQVSKSLHSGSFAKYSDFSPGSVLVLSAKPLLTSVTGLEKLRQHKMGFFMD